MYTKGGGRGSHHLIIIQNIFKFVTKKFFVWCSHGCVTFPLLACIKDFNGILHSALSSSLTFLDIHYAFMCTAKTKIAFSLVCKLTCFETHPYLMESLKSVYKQDVSFLEHHYTTRHFFKSLGTCFFPTCTFLFTSALCQMSWRTAILSSEIFKNPCFDAQVIF